MNTRTATRTLDQKFNSSTITQDDRRRRPRLMSEAVGYLLMDDATEMTEPTEVRVQDVSRLGVGFLTKLDLNVGSICRIRIGYGPMRLARRMRVRRCEPFSDGAFLVGAEFA